MAERNNAVCAICGRGYYMCMSCKDKMALSPWKIHTDTSEHYKIFQILRGETTGVYTTEEAKNRLQKVDLSDIDTFTEHIKNRINNIMKNDAIESISVSVDAVNTQTKQFRKRKSSVKTTEQINTVP